MAGGDVYLSQLPEYKAVHDARDRCTRSGDPSFSYYGARGIEYRLPWNLSVATAQLIDAIGRRPEGMTLDRIDNAGHYEIGNLRWATRAEQNKNKRPSNAVKTHCPQGHPYDETNTYVIPSSGGRMCRACSRVATKRQNTRKKEAKA